jgi:tetratricopeptide (TPR) repeat protein
MSSRTVAALGLLFLMTTGLAVAEPTQDELALCAHGENADRAVEACSNIIAAALPDAPERLISVYELRGDAHLRARQFSLAIDDYSEAIRRYSRTHSAGYLLARRAMAYLENRDFGEAVGDADEAAREFPQDASLQNLRCWTRAVGGIDLVVARRACDRSLRMLPNTHDFLSSRGLVGLKDGRFQDAWNDYDAALHWAPDDAANRFGRGVAALRIGRVDEGRADISAAVSSDADVNAVFAKYGIAVVPGPAPLAPSRPAQ